MEKQSFGKLLFNFSLFIGMAVTNELTVFGQVVETTPVGQSTQGANLPAPVATSTESQTTAAQQDANTVPAASTPATMPAVSTPTVKLTEIETVPAPEKAELRVASNVSGLSPSSNAAMAPHPLDRAIEMANSSLTKMRTDVRDYCGLFYRRECFEGTKSEPSYMQLKIRCPRPNESSRVPFSIYMKFLKPRQSAGRECIWVDGFNESKIVAHEARGLIGMRRFYLEPTGMIAMRESRYPIYEAGIENLIKKLIEKAERDRAAGPCIVNFKDNCEVNSRKCSMIEVCHNEQRAPYDFHIARVFIDRETQLPIAYAAYDWPSTPGGKPRLMEEYHYLNLKINVGLTEGDFSADNPSYGYPKR